VRRFRSRWNPSFCKRLKVNAKTEIPTVAFASLFSAILELTPLAAEIAGEDVRPDDIKIRTEVQSPGHIELYCAAAALTILILGMLIVFFVGGKTKFHYKFTKNVTEGSFELSSDGLLEKLLQLRDHSSRNRLAEIEQKHKHSLELLKLELPEYERYIKERLEAEDIEHKRD